MLRVNGDRLWSALMEIGEIGGTPGGGCRRLALSEEDGRARDLFRKWAEEAGCTVTVDGIGNIFARREGTDHAAAPVAIGSHLDTVPTGGKFDGVYGVMAGLEVLRRLRDLDLQTRLPIEVIAWTNEEGARFSPMTMGSSVFTGDMTLDFALSRQDPSGLSVGEALKRIGYAGNMAVGGRPFTAYLEVHVEQGPLLKEGGEQIGVVTGSFKARYFVATIKGQAAHVGPTLMEQRHDALVGAAALTLEIDQIGRSRGRDGRSNAPYLEVYPNVRGVIPQEVRLSCDVRHPDADMALAMEMELRDACRRIAQEARRIDRSRAIFRVRPDQLRSGDEHPDPRDGRGAGLFPTRYSHRWPAMMRGADDGLLPFSAVLRPERYRHQPQRDGIQHARAIPGRRGRAAQCGAETGRLRSIRLQRDVRCVGPEARAGPRQAAAEAAWPKPSARQQAAPVVVPPGPKAMAVMPPPTWATGSTFQPRAASRHAGQRGRPPPPPAPRLASIIWVPRPLPAGSCHDRSG